ncbi:MAG: phosphoribosylglycinamide formyltransferase [Sandaracinobacteroides sp.]
MMPDVCTPDICTPARPRLAVLISGRGSNMLAIAEAARRADYPATLALVLSSNPAAEGLATAALMGLETLAIPHKAYADRRNFDDALTSALEARAIDVIALAGFMRILTPGFIRRWEGRIVNIHPSLLPRHQGLDTHARAIAAGDSDAGCTVHLVTERLDDGPVLARARVPIQPGDTPETLAARVLVEEHRLYPAALADFLAGLQLGR